MFQARDRQDCIGLLTPRTVKFMNVANRIKPFTIMRIRGEQNLNVILFEHFVRI